MTLIDLNYQYKIYYRNVQALQNHISRKRYAVFKKYFWKIWFMTYIYDFNETIQIQSTAAMKKWRGFGNGFWWCCVWFDYLWRRWRENMNQVIILLSRYSDDNSDMIKDCIIFRKNLLFSKMERILKGECIICQKKSWGR